MPRYRVTIKRVLWEEAEFEADSVEDATDMGVRHDCGDGGPWQNGDGGRGLGDDDCEVLAVEELDEDEDVEDDVEEDDRG